jgi:hypothetical protein
MKRPSRPFLVEVKRNRKPTKAPVPLFPQAEERPPLRSAMFEAAESALASAAQDLKPAEERRGPRILPSLIVEEPSLAAEEPAIDEDAPVRQRRPRVAPGRPKRQAGAPVETCEPPAARVEPAPRPEPVPVSATGPRPPAPLRGEAARPARRTRSRAKGAETLPRGQRWKRRLPAALR